MTRRVMRDEDDVTQLHLRAVPQHAIDWRYREVRSQICSIMKVGLAAGFDDVDVALHDQVRGTRQLLHASAARVMIPVRVADEKDLHVTELEAKLPDTRPNLWDVGLEVAVDEDVPLGRRDEVAREPLAADVVEVLRDPKRRELVRPDRRT